MKKLLFLLITLIIFTNVSYASFPDNTFDKLTSIVLQDPEGEGYDHSGWEPSPILGVLFGLILLLSAFFLIREWWRAWRRGIKWVRILTKVLMWIAIVYASLTLIAVTLGFGVGSGMGG